jgi:DNA-binding NtrC family response regulator
VITIELPPLKKRVTDIPLLCDHLLAKNCEKLNKPPKHLSQSVMDLLMKHPWPGNVRELENVLVQGILYSTSNTIGPADIPIDKNGANDCVCMNLGKDMGQLTYKEAKEKTLTQFNHNYIGAMLSMTKGNITQAARRCAMDRQALQQIMKRYAIDPEKFRKKPS